MKNYLNRIGINAVKAGLKIINKEKKNKILKEIKSINLDETSPLEALQKLSDIQKTLKMDEQ